MTKVGAVEDWTIENRTQEVHEFHMHQLHFLVLEENGVPVAHPELRDTYQVGYWDGTSATYPSIKVRMDFRDPEIAGAFVYHCHILEHEDGGMMAERPKCGRWCRIRHRRRRKALSRRDRHW